MSEADLDYLSSGAHLEHFYLPPLTEQSNAPSLNINPEDEQPISDPSEEPDSISPHWPDTDPHPNWLTHFHGNPAVKSKPSLLLLHSNLPLSHSKPIPIPFTGKNEPYLLSTSTNYSNHHTWSNLPNQRHDWMRWLLVSSPTDQTHLKEQALSLCKTYYKYSYILLKLHHHLQFLMKYRTDNTVPKSLRITLSPVAFKAQETNIAIQCKDYNKNSSVL